MTLSELIAQAQEGFDPSANWDDTWRTEGAVLCEAFTTLSDDEVRYFITRNEPTATYLLAAPGGSAWRARCPLEDGHAGAHVALLGWVNERADDARGFHGWFMHWGPSGDDPRKQGNQLICQHEESIEGENPWRCYLHLGHLGSCRRNVEVETETYDGRPGALMDDMWRRTDASLCEQVTALTQLEHEYVTTRWRFDPAWITDGGAVKDFKLWCPLQRDHEGAHVAKLGWADVQFGPSNELFAPGDWFITWGPSEASPRSFGSKGECGKEGTDSEGTPRTCSLMAEHPGACRMNLYAIADDFDFGEYEEFEPSDEDESESEEQSTAHFEQMLVDKYLEGDSIYFEIAMDWGMSEGAVAKIIRRLTTREQREEAMAKRQRLNIMRKQAESALVADEKARLTRELGVGTPPKHSGTCEVQP